MDKIEVSVLIIPDVDSGMVNIKINFPSDQNTISIKDTAHILTAGISTLIKSCSQYDCGIKDYELMKEVIDQLNSEFSSTDNYDIKLTKKEI